MKGENLRSVNPELKNRLWPAAGLDASTLCVCPHVHVSRRARNRACGFVCVCEWTVKAGMRHCGWSD